MGRRGTHFPEDCPEIKTYAKLEAMVDAFLRRDFPLVAILGTPGLSKSFMLESKMKKKGLYVRGSMSALSFYTGLFDNLDQPVLIDDADDFMADKKCRGYVKLLTETNRIKTMRYDTKTKILDEEGVPRAFDTKSPCCIITNAWSDNDPIYGALRSRAELFLFCPDWAECYRYACTWFKDQEILDYIYDRLEVLKAPDLRIIVKAANRKAAGAEDLCWKEVINNHVDNPSGLLMRQLVADSRFETETARIVEWCARTGMDRATWYRRVKELRRFMPKENTPRIKI